MVINRNEIWWASVPDATGSSPRYQRPVLVVQADAFSHSLIQTAVVVVITSNLQLARAPGNVFVSTQESGLPRDSVVNVSQVLTLDKIFLTERVGALSGQLMQQVNEGLRLALSL